MELLDGKPKGAALTPEEQEIWIKGLKATVLETSILPSDYSHLEPWAQKAR